MPHLVRRVPFEAISSRWPTKIWGFPKITGCRFGGRYKKDHFFCLVYIGVPLFRETNISTGPKSLKVHRDWDYPTFSAKFRGQ